MRKPKLDFLTVIKTVFHQLRNIHGTLVLAANATQTKTDIGKPYLLSFLHNMYNSIKLNNHIGLNFKKRRENTNKLSHTSTKIHSQVVSLNTICQFDYLKSYCFFY